MKQDEFEAMINRARAREEHERLPKTKEEWELYEAERLSEAWRKQWIAALCSTALVLLAAAALVWWKVAR